MFNIMSQTPNASMNQSRQSNISSKNNIDDNCKCLHTYMDRRPKLHI
jgi:hypothetical protein